MMPRIVNLTDKRVLIAGFPQSGKRSLLTALTTKGETNATLDVRNFYKEATQTVKITPSQNDEYKLFALMDKLQHENKIIKMVFCLDASNFITPQTDSLAMILEYAKGLQIKLEYFIYVSKVDLVGDDDLQPLQVNIDAILTKSLSPTTQPPVIIYGDSTLVRPLQQVQKLIQALNKSFDIENHFLLLQKNALPGQYTSVADDKQEPTEKQKHLKHFVQVFPTLEHEQPSMTEIVAMKGLISLHTEQSLEELKRIIVTKDNYKFSFSDYTLFYDTIKNSDILKIHQNKTIEKLGVIKILGTQQKLLKQIRAAALDAFKQDMQITLIHNAAKPYDSTFYDRLLTVTDDAKKLELFASHRSNLPSFFLPRQTNSCDQLDEIKKTILAEQNNHRMRHQDLRSRSLV